MRGVATGGEGGGCGLEALHYFRTTVDKCLNPMANAGMGGGGGHMYTI